MEDSFKLAATLLDLPTHIQFEIAHDLGVYENEQPEAVMTPTLCVWVKRIVARGLLDQLKERVFAERDSLERQGFR